MPDRSSISTTASTALVTAQAQLQLVKQQNSTALNQLLGNPDLPLEQFPAYMQAKAALDDAQRNLDLTTVRAPMNGIATQVDQIQLGRFVMAGTPVFSVIDTSNPWVDANPKESDFTYVAVGQSVTLDVDAFPNHVFKGTVGSLSPGTGAQFAILPPQNATGNFVKVVQRVPVRIYFDKQRQVRAEAEGRHERLRHDRHQPSPLARRPARLRRRWRRKRTDGRCRIRPQRPIAVPGLRRNMVTICAMTATIMQALDTTIANVALPYMQGTLSASQDQINWVLTSYIVAAAIMTAPVGWIANRFGRKRIFIVCSGGFTIASVLCGLAQDINQMVLFRLLQGVFGAALVPLSQAVMLDSYALHERAKAMSIWGMGVMMGPIMGPSLGAWLTETYSWHWVFFVNLPFGIFTVLGLMVFMDETRKNRELRFDWFGFAALAVGIGSLADRARPRRTARLAGIQRDHRRVHHLGRRLLLFLRAFADDRQAVHPVRDLQGQELRRRLRVHGGDGTGAVLDHGAVVALPAERDRLSHHHRRPAAGEPRLRHLRRHDAGRPDDALYRGAHADRLRPQPDLPVAVLHDRLDRPDRRSRRSCRSASCRVSGSAWCSCRCPRWRS